LSHISLIPNFVQITYSAALGGINVGADDR